MKNKFTRCIYAIVSTMLVTTLPGFSQTPGCTTISAGTWTNPGTLIVDIHGTVTTPCADPNG